MLPVEYCWRELPLADEWGDARDGLAGLKLFKLSMAVIICNES